MRHRCAKRSIPPELLATRDEVASNVGWLAHLEELLGDEVLAYALLDLLGQHEEAEARNQCVIIDEPSPDQRELARRGLLVLEPAQQWTARPADRKK